MKKCKVFRSDTMQEITECVAIFVNNKIKGKFDLHWSADENDFYCCILYEDDQHDQEKTTRYFKCEMSDEEYEKLIYPKNGIEPSFFYNDLYFEEINQTHIDKIAR